MFHHQQQQPSSSSTRPPTWVAPQQHPITAAQEGRDAIQARTLAPLHHRGLPPQQQHPKHYPTAIGSDTRANNRTDYRPRRQAAPIAEPQWIPLNLRPPAQPRFTTPTPNMTKAPPPLPIVPPASATQQPQTGNRPYQFNALLDFPPPPQPTPTTTAKRHQEELATIEA